MKEIRISEEIITACPELRLAVISCEVQNTPYNEALWQEIARKEEAVRSQNKMEDINKSPPIRATRQTYKALGKDPNRYRPSAESLRRRIIKGMPLYKIDTLVDLINLLSIESGHSISGFDEDKIEGDVLELGIGRKDELYHGIGRGELNIEGLPVYRDSAGGIGTPTSDEERTKITMETTRLLMIINAYSGNEGLDAFIRYSVERLCTYASAKTAESRFISR